MSERVRDIESQLRKTNQPKIDYSLSSSKGAEQIKARQKKEIESAQKKYEATKNGVKQETREGLEKEKWGQVAKKLVYDNLGINDDLAKNTAITNFLKGMIDSVLIGNIELIEEVIKTKGSVLVDALKSLFSIEGIKQIANVLKTNVIDLFDGDAYKKGKSSAELIITAMGAYGTIKLTKFLIKKVPKATMKIQEIGQNISKVLVEAKKLSIDDIMKLTNNKERLTAIANLGDKERFEIAKIYFKKYFKKELDEVHEKAIIAAHKVGKNRKEAGVGKYTPEEILKKARILRGVKFNKEEIRILMEEGICGGLSKAESTTMIDSITRLFGGDKIDVIKSSTSVAKRAELARELGIVPRFVGKKIEEVNQILKGEIEIIQNTKQSLEQLLKGMDWSDRSLAESLLKRSNEWISIRLANLEKFVIFVEEASLQNMSDVNLVSATNSFKDKIINEGIIPLGKAMNELKNSGDLILNPRNEILLYNHYERLRGIKPHKISN